MLLRAGSRVACAVVTISGAPDCLNFAINFEVYMRCKNVTSGRVTRPVEAQVVRGP